MPTWSIMALAIVGLFLLIVVLPAYFSYAQTVRLLTPRRTVAQRHPRDYGLQVEDVRIPGPRGQLAAWYIPARNGCTLICCHGIHDNRGQWVEQVARLHRRSGYGAVLFDFIGHGESEGNLVTYGVREAHDVEAIVAYLRTRGDVDMQRLGVMGYSLGAISATLAAARLPELRCTIIESGFADVARDLSLLFKRYTGLPSFPFANLVVFWGQRIARVRLSDIRPVRVIGDISPRAIFIIGDLADELANEPYDSDHLYAAAREPKRLWQVPDAGHVRAYDLVPDEWIERVGSFLDEYLAATPAGPELQATRPMPEQGA
jgi:uncharacterized protein